METTRLEQPFVSYIYPREFKPVLDGSIYVGKINSDPIQLDNRIAVYIENVDGTLTETTQPIKTNAAGIPVVLGEIVKLVVKEAYSVAVLDDQGAQLYYFAKCDGPQASPEGSLLHVFVDSVQGDDTHAGTREHPFRTLGKALEVTPSDASNTIYLKSGQTYLLDKMVEVKAGATRVIRVYDDPYIEGDKVPTITRSSPHYSWWAVKDLARPTIQAHVNYDFQTETADLYCITCRPGGTLNIQGCIIDGVPSNNELHPTWSTGGEVGMFAANPNAALFFDGCIIRAIPKDSSKYFFWIVGPAYLSRFQRCIAESDGTFINFRFTTACYEIADSKPNEYTVPYMMGNMADTSILPGRIAGLVEVHGTNIPRNVLTNLNRWVFE